MPSDEVDLSSIQKKDFSFAWSRLFQGGLIVLLVVLAYLPALRGGFIWDDDSYVTQNPTLHDGEGLRQIWFKVGAVPQYYPMVHTTFWLEYHLWVLNPIGYHLINVLMHAIAAILLWQVLLRLQTPGAWLAAGLFALHPIEVESVAWVTERKNVLSAVFYFAAALSYLRFVALEKPGSSNRRRWSWYLGALVLFTAALLSKTVTCSLPAVLLLLCWWKNGRIQRGDIIPLLPFFVVGVALGLMTAWIEKYHVGAQGAAWSLTFADRCLIAGRALWFYAGKLVWPAHLTFIYPRWEIEPAVWWQWLFPIAAIGVVAGLWLARRRIGKGPLVAVLCFAGTLGPALGFVDVYPMRYSFVADHFQYLASIGLLALAAAGITTALGPYRRGKPFLEPMFGGILLLVMGTLTWRQTAVYRNSETLWRDTLAKNADSWMAHDNLGAGLQGSGRFEEAMEHFRKSIELNPNGVVARNDYAVALRQCGRLDEAEMESRMALKLGPNLLAPHINLIAIFRQRGQLNEAVQEYETALQLAPTSEAGHIGLADTLCLLGRAGDAIPQYRQVLQSDPGNTEVRIRLGRALVERGDFGAAESEFSTVLQSEPRNARAIDGLGYLLAMQGRLDEARARFLESMQLDPKDAYAHLHYAICLSAQRQAREAMAEYRKALELDDQLSPACNNLAWMLAAHPDPQVRNGKEAVELAERACRLTGSEQPFYLGTLAAAYAEAGRFNDAIATAEKARDLARRAGQKEVAARNEELLELYRAGRPYHESADAN